MPAPPSIAIGGVGAAGPVRQCSVACSRHAPIEASIAVSGSSGALRSSSMSARYAATWRACSSSSQPRSSASRRGHVGRGLARRVAREQPGAGAAGQHIVEREDHLVARREDRLGLEVGEPRDQRLGERRIALDHGEQRACLAPVAIGQMLDGRLVGDRVRARPRRARRRNRRHRAAGAAWCGCAVAPARARAWDPPSADSSRAQHLLEHVVDRVGGHLAVRRELAAGDRDDAAVGASSPGDGVTGRRCVNCPRRARAGADRPMCP